MSEIDGLRIVVTGGASGMGEAIKDYQSKKAKARGEVEIDRGLSFSLSRLLTWPIGRDIETQRLAQARLQVASEVLRQAFEVRQAWYQAVAAQELLAHSQRVLEAAQVGAELAKRMQGVGNFNRITRAREQAFYADAATRLSTRSESATPISGTTCTAGVPGVSGTAVFNMPMNRRALWFDPWPSGRRRNSTWVPGSTGLYSTPAARYDSTTGFMTV